MPFSPRNDRNKLTDAGLSQWSAPNLCLATSTTISQASLTTCPWSVHASVHHRHHSPNSLSSDSGIRMYALREQGPGLVPCSNPRTWNSGWSSANPKSGERMTSPLLCESSPSTVSIPSLPRSLISGFIFSHSLYNTKWLITGWANQAVAHLLGIGRCCFLYRYSSMWNYLYFQNCHPGWLPLKGFQTP